MRFKRILSFLASAAMTISALCGAMSITASAVAITTGDLTWEVNGDTLTINVASQEPGAKAAMLDYQSNKAPWYSSYSTKIKNVKISEGVTSIGTYAFSRCTAIISVELPSTLTSIGAHAFDSCTKLATISFTDAAGESSETPPQITTFGDYAFNYCSALEAVPASFLQYTTSIGDYAFYSCAKMFPTEAMTTAVLATLGQYAFYGCTSLTSLTLKSSWSGDRITAIPQYAFAKTGLTTITLPTSGLTEIGQYAFQDCKSLTRTPTFSSSITTIGAYAFSGCSSLDTVTLPSGVKTFGGYIFQNCTSIQTVSIPSSWTTIPQYMFNGCSSLETVKFSGNNLISIENTAFGYTSITSIDIPESVTTIDNYAFSQCKNLETVSLKRGVTEIGRSAFSGCSALEAITLPNTVKTLGENVLSDCKALKAIMVPSSVTKIPSNAFGGCTNLASVDLPDSVESIDVNAFQNCTSLKTISLPKNLKSVTGQAFTGCTSLTAIKAHPESTVFANSTKNSYSGILLNADKTELIAYPEGSSTSISVGSVESTITKIGDYAFYGNKRLSSIDFGSVVEEIGNYSFALTNISSVSIPSSVVSIGVSAFDAYTYPIVTGKLATLDLSKATSLESIGDCAFRYTSVKSFTLPDNSVLKTIGEDAFYQCQSLTTVDFKSGGVLESIGEGAFYNCIALTSVAVPDTVTNLGTSVFSGCSAMTSARLSKKLTALPNSTFRSCTNLKAVTFPSTITSVGSYAFAACSSLSDVEIPNSVTTIGEFAFQNCTSLKKAVIGTQVTAISNNAFSGSTNEDLEIYLMGTIIDINASTSFGNNTSSYVKGTIYVYDDTSYTTLLKSNAVKTAGYATLKFAANFTDLRNLIIEAKSYPSVNYTDASYSVLASALTLAEVTVADYASTQGRVDTSVSSLRNAINGLVEADNTELLSKLAEAVEHAKSLVRTDYRTKEYTQLRAAYKAGEEVTGDELNSELQPLIDAIEKAEQNLVVSYAYSDPVLTVQSGKEYSDLFAYTYPAMEGTTTEAEAGATQARITFDVASHVSWGQYTTFHFKSYIQGVDESGNYIEFNDEEQDKTDDNGAGVYESKPTGALGETGLKITFDLVNPLRVGDVYHIYTYTRDYGDEIYRPYDFLVFYIREVELLDADGNVLLSTKDVNVPNEDLLAAVEEAKLANTANATEDSVQVLNDAVAAANAILEQEKPLPSAMAAAAEAIRDAIANLKQADKPSVDKTELNNEIKSADDMDTSAYTDESVAALKTAIDSAKTVAANENATKEDVDAAVKAIKDAVAALAKKPGSSDSSNNPSGSNNPSVTTPTAAPTTAAPAKRSAQQVAKDKAAAQAKVSQAKITKLTVKSKAKKKINVTWKKVKKAVGYQVQVSTKSNFKKKIFNKFTTKNKLTITNKLKSKKTYYVRVRAYATYKDANNVTKKVYSKWNKKLRKVTVK